MSAAFTEWKKIQASLPVKGITDFYFTEKCTPVPNQYLANIINEQMQNVPDDKNPIEINSMGANSSLFISNYDKKTGVDVAGHKATISVTRYMEKPKKLKETEENSENAEEFIKLNNENNRAINKRLESFESFKQDYQELSAKIQGNELSKKDVMKLQLLKDEFDELATFDKIVLSLNFTCTDSNEYKKIVVDVDNELRTFAKTRGSKNKVNSWMSYEYKNKYTNKMTTLYSLNLSFPQSMYSWDPKTNEISFRGLYDLDGKKEDEMIIKVPKINYEKGSKNSVIDRTLIDEKCIVLFQLKSFQYKPSFYNRETKENEEAWTPNFELKRLYTLV